MDQAGIPKRRQATPQAPPRDFKPRKNGTPAVPSTPPANVPRAMPQPAPQMTPPPMQGAQRSMGQSPAPVQRQTQAPPQQQARRSGGFNPMQGPMGANMGTARNAAATMFMPQAMSTSMPSPSQQGPMMQQATQAPAPRQVAPVVPSPKRTAAQRAAIDIAGLMPGDMQAFSDEEAGFRPVTPPGGPIPQGESGDSESDTLVLPGSPYISQVPSSGLYGLEASMSSAGQGSTGTDKQQANMELLAALSEGRDEYVDYAKSYLDENGFMSFINTFGREVYDDIFGPGASEQAMKDEYDNAMAARDAQKMAGALVGSGLPMASTGVNKEMFDAIATALGGQAEEGYDEENLFQNVMDVFLDAITGKTEGVITEDMMQAQAQNLKGEAAASKAALAQQMAMRGMGASGLYGAGFGNVDSQLVDALNKLYTDAATANAEFGLNQAQIAGSIMSALRSDDTKREMFEYQKEQDEIANAEILKQHAVAMYGADGWAPGESGRVTELLAAGVPWHEIESRLKVVDGYVSFGQMGPEEKQALIDKYASGSSAQPGQKSEDGSTFTNPDGTFYLNEDGDFMSLDDLQSMYDSDDPLIQAKFEAAKAKFEQASGGSVGNSKQAWENLTNESGMSSLNNDLRREFLGFLAQELGFTFPPPGVEYEAWHGMPENLRAKYWAQYMDGEQGGYGSVWNPYGSVNTNEPPQEQEPGEQGDGQDSQQGATMVE